MQENQRQTANRKAAKSAYNLKYKELNRERLSEYRKNRRIENYAFFQKRDADRCRQAKLDAFDRYGGRNCALCPEKRVGALTIDHIAGKGGLERKATKCSSGKKFYCWLRKHKYPPGFRVLCANCNWREYRRLRSGTEKQAKYNIRQKAIKRKIKIDVMTKIGGCCKLCGLDDIEVLTVHHINNDGAEHRRQLSKGVSGYAFYTALRRTGNYKGLECRCFSCNCCEEWTSTILGD